ncbi:MAG: hypothetical protein EOP52_13125 [Sphingobacteriales bacterium]|nr:MAG: hypothetical protein EOP52_13125 [Sphingobacteriales bacterium]
MNSLIAAVITLIPIIMALLTLALAIVWTYAYKSLPDRNNFFTATVIKSIAIISLHATFTYIIAAVIYTMANMNSQLFSLEFLPLFKSINSISECYMKNEQIASCGLELSVLLLSALYLYAKAAWDNLQKIWSSLFDIS